MTRETGWYWQERRPLNYNERQPNGLPRSQDAQLLKETTGFYLIEKEPLFRKCTRIGTNPWLYEIPHQYAIDIDTEEDFAEAERILCTPT